MLGSHFVAGLFAVLVLTSACDAREAYVHFNDGTTERGSVEFGTSGFPAVIGNDVHMVTWSDIRSLEITSVTYEPLPPGASSCYGVRPLPTVKGVTKTGRVFEVRAAKPLGPSNSTASGSFCYTSVAIKNPITEKVEWKSYEWINHRKACTDYPDRPLICGFVSDSTTRQIRKIDFEGK